MKQIGNIQEYYYDICKINQIYHIEIVNLIIIFININQTEFTPINIILKFFIRPFLNILFKFFLITKW